MQIQPVNEVTQPQIVIDMAQTKDIQVYKIKVPVIRYNIGDIENIVDIDMLREHIQDLFEETIKYFELDRIYMIEGLRKQWIESEFDTKNVVAVKYQGAYYTFQDKAHIDLLEQLYMTNHREPLFKDFQGKYDSMLLRKAHLVDIDNKNDNGIINPIPSHYETVFDDSCELDLKKNIYNSLIYDDVYETYRFKVGSEASLRDKKEVTSGVIIDSDMNHLIRNILLHLNQNNDLKQMAPIVEPIPTIKSDNSSKLLRQMAFLGNPYILYSNENTSEMATCSPFEPDTPESIFQGDPERVIRLNKMSDSAHSTYIGHYQDVKACLKMIPENIYKRFTDVYELYMIDNLFDDIVIVQFSATGGLKNRDNNDQVRYTTYASYIVTDNGLYHINDYINNQKFLYFYKQLYLSNRKTNDQKLEIPAIRQILESI